MAEHVDIVMPDSGEGTESVVGQWLKAPGDPVTEHEPVVEIATDKVTLEVPAPATGTLSETLVEPNQDVAPGDVLGRIAVGTPEPVSAGVAGTAPGGGSGAGDGPRTGDVAPGAAGGLEGADGSTGGVRTAGASAPSGSRGNGGRTPTRGVLVSGRYVEPSEHRALSPAVRRLVSEHDLDVGAIDGTGRGGRITFRDVEAYLAANPDSARRAHPATRGVGARTSSTEFVPSATGKAATSLYPGIPVTPTGRDADGAPKPPVRSIHAAPASGAIERVAHTPMRKGIADHMVRSLLHTAPHVTAIMEADLTRVRAHQRAHRDAIAAKGHRLTLTAYFVVAAAKALRAVPETNARWADDAVELIGDCNVGIATAVRGGLMVPVIKNAENLDLAGVAAKLTDMTARTRDGKLRLDEVQSGTFTITNHGASGSLIATPIINQPQSAILGIGKLEKRVVVREVEGADTLQIRPMVYVTLTIDHRVLDGFQANMFLGSFVEVLEGWGG